MARHQEGRSSSSGGLLLSRWQRVERGVVPLDGGEPRRMTIRQTDKGSAVVWPVINDFLVILVGC